MRSVGRNGMNHSTGDLEEDEDEEGGDDLICICGRRKPVLYSPPRVPADSAGIPLRFRQNGRNMKFLWIPLDFQWNSREFPWKFQGNSHGFQVEFEWNSHGFPVEFEWNFYELKCI